MQVGQKLFKLMKFTVAPKKDKPGNWYIVQLRAFDIDSNFIKNIDEFISEDLANKLIAIGLNSPGFDGIPVNVTVGFDRYFRKVITDITEANPITDITKINLTESEVIF